MRHSHITKEQMEHAYLVDLLPLAEIARLLGYASGKQVDKMRRAFGIPTRGLSATGCYWRRPHRLQGIVLSPAQRQVVLGTLLGDGSVSARHPNTQAGNSYLRADHSITQEAYVRWMATQLGEFTSHVGYGPARASRLVPNSNPRIYLQTISHPEFTALRSLLYSSGKKHIPEGYVESIGDTGLAVWCMDDATRCVKRLVFSTEGYSVEEQLMMCAAMNEIWAADARLIACNSGVGQHIALSRAGSLAVRDRIAPHFCPSMLYKLDW